MNASYKAIQYLLHNSWSRHYNVTTKVINPIHRFSIAFYSLLSFHPKCKANARSRHRNYLKISRDTKNQCANGTITMRAAQHRLLHNLDRSMEKLKNCSFAFSGNGNNSSSNSKQWKRISLLKIIRSGENKHNKHLWMKRRTAYKKAVNNSHQIQRNSKMTSASSSSSSRTTKMGNELKSQTGPHSIPAIASFKSNF